MRMSYIGSGSTNEKKLVRELFDSLILKHEAKRWTA